MKEIEHYDHAKNEKKIVLTGIKPTGQPHIGNYLGVMKPALEMAHSPGIQAYFFMADYHSLISEHNPQRLHEMIYEVAAAWLACGLDPQKTVFYRQSAIPELFELNWILSCFTAKGLLNRAHAYKAKVSENQIAGREEVDFGVSVGLFTYPVLMAADILAFGTHVVPVGEDQIQHVEIARDLAQKFNHVYRKKILVVPDFLVQKGTQLVPGLDGRKMSKSYDNHIPLFCTEKKLRQLIMKIKTDSSTPEEPKNPETSLVFQIFKEFATEAERDELTVRYQQGISWGEAKQILFEKINHHLQEPRKKYMELIADRDLIDEKLKRGAEEARSVAIKTLNELRVTIGMRG